jgi:hypothetical protein
MFNNMAIHCMGSSTTINGEARSRGLCNQADKDGDQLFHSYDNVGHPGQPYAATETSLVARANTLASPGTPNQRGKS